MNHSSVLGLTLRCTDLITGLMVGKPGALQHEGSVCIPSSSVYTAALSAEAHMSFVTSNNMVVSALLIWGPVVLLGYSRTSGGGRICMAGKPVAARGGVMPCFLFRYRRLMNLHEWKNRVFYLEIVYNGQCTGC